MTSAIYFQIVKNICIFIYVISIWNISHTWKWNWKSLSHVWVFVTPWTVACHGPMVPPGIMVPHGILQAKILEWVVIPFSRGSSQPRDWTHVSCNAGGFFTIWATREAQWALGNLFSSSQPANKELTNCKSCKVFLPCHFPLATLGHWA